MDQIAQANELAKLYTKGGNYDKAAALLEQAIKISPSAELHCNLATVYGSARKMPEAIEQARKAVSLDNSAFFLNALGLQLERHYQIAEAIEVYQAALDLRSDAEIWVNLGNVYQTARQFHKSTAAYHNALTLLPNNPGILCNLGYNHLSQKKYAQGWPLYEYRLKLYDPLKDYLKAYGPDKLWQGEDLKGKDIALYAEQGYGDVLQFIRYVPALRERYLCRTTLVVPPKLLTLLRWQEGLGIVTDKKPEHYDYHCPLMSLPHRLNLPTYDPGPYIKSNRTTQLVGWHEPHKPGLNVGILWAGNPDHPNDLARSVPRAHFDNLAMEGVNLWPLHKDYCPFPLDTWRDTAAIINSLDLVITVDTAVLHLAAAMGKQVWGLIAYRPDFRWGIEGGQPWYQSLTLYRQETPHDWATVFNKIKADLFGIVRNR